MIAVVVFLADYFVSDLDSGEATREEIDQIL